MKLQKTSNTHTDHLLEHPSKLNECQLNEKETDQRTKLMCVFNKSHQLLIQ